MAAKNDNFKAGLFVVVGLIVAFVAIIMLSDIDGMFAETRTITVRFSLKDGLQGLREGAMVTIGNYPVGSVRRIDDEMVDGKVVAKLVRAEIPAEYQLYDNAEIELNVPPLGGGTAMNIRSVGYDASDRSRKALRIQGWRLIRLDDQGRPVRVPEDLREQGFTADDLLAQGETVVTDGAGGVKRGESWEYQEGEIIRGGVAASPLVVDLVAEVGIGDVQRQQLREIIGNFHSISANLARNPQRYDELIEDVGALAGDARSVLASLKDRSPQWFDRVDAITSDLEGILSENRPVIREGLAEARDALVKADDLLARVKDQTIDKIDAMLDKANLAVDDVQTTVRELNTLLVTQRPVIERMIANMRLTSDQLKLAAIEIRRSPWRLLYTPTDKELETDNLYDAARSFALAAGSLETTAESLKALVDKRGETIPTDDANLNLMLDNLRKTFEHFAEAEDKFWDALDRKIESP